MVEQGAGYAHTLLLAAREFVGEVGTFVLQPHRLQHFLDAGIAGLAFPARGTKHKAQVLLHGHLVDETEVLEHHAQFAAQCRQMLRFELAQVVAQHRGLAALNGQLGIQALEQRALARPYAAGDIDKIVLLHAQVHVFKHTVSLLL